LTNNSVFLPQPNLAVGKCGAERVLHYSNSASQQLGLSTETILRSVSWTPKLQICLEMPWEMPAFQWASVCLLWSS